MKTCTVCRIEKPLDGFSAQANGKFGVTSICKPCTSERGKRWYAENRDRARDNRTAYAEANKERLRQYAKGWRAANAVRQAELAREWTKNNMAKKRAATASRRAAKLRATPAWADAHLLQSIYRWANEFASATGTEVHVDHVVPLVSGVVCGLHCPANLIVRTGKSNRAKGNKWDVDATFYP